MRESFYEAKVKALLRTLVDTLPMCPKCRSALENKSNEIIRQKFFEPTLEEAWYLYNESLGR